MHSFSTQWDFINTHFKVKAPILTLSCTIGFIQNILESKKCSSVQIEEVSYTERKQASIPIPTETKNTEKSAR